MQPKCYLVRDEHIPVKAAFPVIDAHNHLWGNWQSLARAIPVMDAVGVALYADLTANISIEFSGGGYRLGPGRIEDFLTHIRPYPNRFYAFTTATFAAPADQPLFDNADTFVAETIAMLRQHVTQGAHGLKILKELGLHYRDARGALIPVDDPRLAPIWDEAAALKIPVLMHQSDPIGFFEPVTPANEHYDSMIKYPTWSFADTARFPRKATIIAQRDRVLRRHPRTTFLLPHVANYPEDLGYVARLLDENPNAHIDFSARLDELGRQPYRAREFLIKYQDRVYFGSDMPPSLEMYRCYFRFLETWDEYFFHPDYDGTFDRHRWHICGLGLPKEVLRKIYYRNALKLVPGLRAAYKTACNGLH